MEQRTLPFLALGQELVEERFADVMYQESLSRSTDCIEVFGRLKKGP
jgi:hypothetical protein